MYYKKRRLSPGSAWNCKSFIDRWVVVRVWNWCSGLVGNRSNRCVVIRNTLLLVLLGCAGATPNLHMTRLLVLSVASPVRGLAMPLQRSRSDTDVCLFALISTNSEEGNPQKTKKNPAVCRVVSWGGEPNAKASKLITCDQARGIEIVERLIQGWEGSALAWWRHG